MVNAKLAGNDFKAGYPEPGSLIVFLSFFLLVAGQIFFIVIDGVMDGLFTVTVVRFIVKYHNTLHAHQFRHDPLEHLPFGFKSMKIFAASLEQGTSAFR